MKSQPALFAPGESPSRSASGAGGSRPSISSNPESFSSSMVAAFSLNACDDIGGGCP